LKIFKQVMLVKPYNANGMEFVLRGYRYSGIICVIKDGELIELYQEEAKALVELLNELLETKDEG